MGRTKDLFMEERLKEQQREKSILIKQCNNSTKWELVTQKERTSNSTALKQK
jgi:hypothetical protein